MNESQAHLDNFLKMTPAEREKACAEYNANNQIAKKEAIEKNILISNRYNDMLASVVQWQVPEELTGLKDFMLSQLDESKAFDVDDEPGKYIPGPVTPDVWYSDAIVDAKHDIEYYTQRLEEEQKRHDEWQAWLDKLWETLD